MSHPKTPDKIIADLQDEIKEFIGKFVPRHRNYIKIRELKASLKSAQNMAQAKNREFLDILDFMDIELFLEDVVDAKTGKKVEIPKEIWDLWDIYWEHIKEALKSKLKSQIHAGTNAKTGEDKEC